MTTNPQTRFLIVVPSHDEEAGIAETVRSCRSVNYPAELFQVLVIADNCADRTAAIARQEGATVLERRVSTRMSKGYAIEYLIGRLQESRQIDGFDALVIVDADSTVSQGLLSGFAVQVEAGHDWIQCLYSVSNPDASWRTRLMAYAFSLFNGVTLIGQSALGLGAAFRGNGMCITIRGLQRVPWKSHGLVEDMEYSWNVRISGGKVAFLSDHYVQGVMLEHGGSAATSQRQRWETGRDEVRMRYIVPLIRSRRLNVPEKVALFLELTMPSMVQLLSYYCSVLMANLIFLYVASASGVVASFLIGSTALMSLAILIYAISPFVLFKLSWSYLLILPYLPFYALWKFVVALRSPPTQWIRTPREQPLPPGSSMIV
jgi:cellulose synthase/poly-beta-1,6-N-acetylglucosamine synthase-like glycosyltransferase